MRLAITNGSGQYWNGTAFQAGSTTVNATLATSRHAQHDLELQLRGHRQRRLHGRRHGGRQRRGDRPVARRRRASPSRVWPTPSRRRPALDAARADVTAGPVTFSGTATDNVGVARVEVAIQNLEQQPVLERHRLVQSGFRVRDTATLGTPEAANTTLELRLDHAGRRLPAAGYRVQVRAVDTSNIVDTTPVGVGQLHGGPCLRPPRRTRRSRPRRRARSSPRRRWPSPATPRTRPAVAPVRLAIVNGSDQYWTGSAWQAAATTVNATLASPERRPRGGATASTPERRARSR